MKKLRAGNIAYIVKHCIRNNMIKYGSLNYIYKMSQAKIITPQPNLKTNIYCESIHKLYISAIAGKGKASRFRF